MPISELVRRKDIRNGENANDVGDVLGAEAVRIAAAVEIFVVVPDRIEDFG
ncbi:hypothetical protein ACVWZ6_004647 [Bradyrhizobium sp. GM6.1]|jgi:hypothetical protein